MPSDRAIKHMINSHHGMLDICRTAKKTLDDPEAQPLIHPAMREAMKVVFDTIEVGLRCHLVYLEGDEENIGALLLGLMDLRNVAERIVEVLPPETT